MNFLFWGLTIGVIGKILVAVGILRVHYVMAMEKSIDEIVIRSFRFEKLLTYIGIILIVAGYVLELYYYGDSNLLTCGLGTCRQATDALVSQ
ncbi:MAG: hypothetical protein ACK42D_03775 [Candidatus Paceibacteria bacterium]